MGSGAGSVTIWGGDLGIVSSNVQNNGGGPCGIPMAGDKQDGETTVVRDVEEGGSGECPQRSGDTETGEVHLESTNDSGGMGSVDTDI